MNKFFIVIVIAIVVAGGYLFIKKTPESVAPASQTPSLESATNESTPQPITEEKIITYTDAGYSPSSLQIKTGDIVVFKNESSGSMWPASAMHPTHRDYPTTGGCIGSTFDACQAIQSGDNWSFQFDIAGAWKYHDHLSPKDFGAITVE